MNAVGAVLLVIPSRTTARATPVPVRQLNFN